MPAPKKAKKAVKSRRADTADGAEEASLAAVPQSPPEPPRSLRVLLVDDDAEIIESMRTVLESKGYEILVARDGNQGLLMAERENPDLVVLDMMMPKRSGFLVLERLRRSRPVPMRVIMITANEGSRHRAYAEMLGVDDYIRKPFAMDRLLDSVQRLLGAAR
ncbi:MAG: response regulator [Planctomycetia bacterium]